MRSTISAEQVIDHFEAKGKVWPNITDGLLFTQTELSEAIELILGKDREYVRNNPDDKEAYTPERFAEELGDVIYMCIITGVVAGVNPIDAMHNKMRKAFTNNEIS